MISIYCSKDELRKRIFELREELYRTAFNGRLTDKDILEKSQQLDRLLNRYYKIMSLTSCNTQI